MDKETLSNYGWIVICVLVLAVMIALATPFGSYISDAIKSTSNGLFDVNQEALGAAGITIADNEITKYSIINNPATEVTQGDVLVLQSDADFDKFVKVTANGEEVPEKYYTVTEGSTVVTFTIEFSKDYTGTYEFVIVSNDGTAKVTITLTPKQELTTLTKMTWKGLTNFEGENVWTYGGNIYYSEGSQQYVLNGDTWEPKTWNGYNPAYGMYIWTDGDKMYYSEMSNHYVLEGDTWVRKTWNGPSWIMGNNVWTDGKDIYYSWDDDYKHYKLNGDTWELITLEEPTSYYGTGVWTDGTNTYYSYNGANYVWNDGKWEKKTWEGCNNFTGQNVWKFGSEYYLSRGSVQYVLKDGKWEKKTWEGERIYLDGFQIWTDGEFLAKECCEYGIHDCKSSIKKMANITA